MKQILAVFMLVSFSGSLGLAENNEPPQISISKQKMDELNKLGQCINLSGSHCAIVNDEGNLIIYIQEVIEAQVPGPEFLTKPVIY